MDEARFGQVAVQLVRGDLTVQPDLDAIVNAANAQLRPGGGVAGAVHRAAGPGLARECEPLAPIEPGACVLTGGHGLPNAHVLHCLGPVYGQDEPADELLSACYRRALTIADETQLRSVGFPAISTGVFGYPIPQAAEVALRTVAAEAPDLEHVRLVRFVLFAETDLAVHGSVLERLASS